MKIFTLLKGLFFFTAMVAASSVFAQSVTISVPTAATTSILKSQTVDFTSGRSGTFTGSGNTYNFSWNASPTTGVSFSPASGSGSITSHSTTATFSSNGSFSVTSAVKRGTGTTVTSAAKTVNVYTVDAGADQNIATGSVSLSGSASGGSGISSYLWSKTSGGNVTITSSSLAATTVTGLTDGTYVFRLTINGLTDVIYDEVTVTVATPTAPVGCNGQFYVSHGPISGPNGSTLLEKLSFSGLNITPSNFALTPGGFGFNALGINPIDGYAYAVRYPASGAKAHLLKIGVGGTNEVDLGQIGTLANDDIAYSACFDADGTFYFTTQSGKLYKIANPTSSLTAVLAATNSTFGSIADIAINPVDGQMYGTTNSNSSWLYKINKSTGALTAVAGVPNLGSSHFFASLFFDEVGQMFGYRSDGPFYLINKTNGSLTAAGTGASYSGADGCSCSFGRVFHDLTGASICPTAINPNPTFNITVAVTNQSSTQKTGLTYTLEIPSNRFSFNQTPETIASNLAALGLLPSANAGFVTISSTVGTNNKIVITSLQTGGVNAVVSFTLQLKLITLGGAYNPVHMQSVISGLPTSMGNDLSNDPTTVSPDDSTLIDFCPGITLPVKLISFKGNLENGTAKLTWESAAEESISGYIVQRSYNGNDWNDVGEVNAANRPSSYAYNDPVVNNPEKIYYRLKIVEVAGFSYSGVVVLKTSSVIGNITVAPNPFKDQLQLSINSSDVENVSYSLLTAEGKQLKTSSQKLSRGSNVFFLNDLGSLQTGVYFLQVQYNNEVKTIKLLKADR